MDIKKLVVFVFAVLVMASCGKSEKRPFRVDTEPSEEIIQEMGINDDYSIVLHDMDIEEKPEMMVYKHKYHILKLEKDSLVVDSLDWAPVNKAYFVKHQDDLGMEVVSNHEGILTKTAKPVGFGWAIGNPKEGDWVSTEKDSTKVTQNTRRTWRPRASSMLFVYWMMRRPAYRSDYRGYRTNESRGGAYYGKTSTGKSKYGTNSTYQKGTRPSHYSRAKSSSSWKGFRNSKSSSRYKGSSKTRSRSGGFGK